MVEKERKVEPANCAVVESVDVYVEAEGGDVVDVGVDVEVVDGL